MHVCMAVWVWVHKKISAVHTWVHNERSPLIVLYLLYLLRQGLWRSPEVTDLSSLASQLVLGILCLSLPSTGIAESTATT